MSEITLIVCIHPSGRHTLKKSVDGKLASDLRGALFGNFDKAEFDKAKNKLVADLEREGHDVIVKE